MSTPSTASNPAISTGKTDDLTAVGFWLPCGRANFIRHHADHGLCSDNEFDLAAIVKKDLEWRITQSQKEGTIEDEGIDAGESVSPETVRLQSSVFRRLLTVLDRKGYTRAFGIKPDLIGTLSDDDTDPSAVLLTAQQFEESDWPTEKDRSLWPDTIPENQRAVHKSTKDAVRAIALIVSARGFYLWMATHPGVPPAPEGFAPPQIVIQLALRKHIARLIGGDYYSHIAKPSNTPEAGQQPQTLEEYRDGPKMGFLTFFQLNTLLEGLYSYTFDPRIFFQLGGSNPDEVKKNYSIGRFIRHIVAVTTIGSDKQSTAPAPAASVTSSTASSSSGSSAPEEAAPTIKREDKASQEDICSLIVNLARDGPTAITMPDEVKTTTQRLRKHCLNNEVRRDLLRQFMRKVAVVTLQTMKWRIERTRRALLTEVIEITHRQEPLDQLESPEQSDYIEEVNEAQLRGYVMLFAAKYPLILNVDRYLMDAYDSIEIEKAGKKPEEIARLKKLYFEPLEGFKHAWTALIKGIDDNIKGLERAVEQARMDRLVYEEQQIRAVQETLGEIDRIRERSDTSLSPTSSLAVNILGSMLAVAAVAITFFGILPRYTSLLSQLTLEKWILSIVISALIIILLLLLANSVLQWIIGGFVQIYFRLRKLFSGQSKRHNERLYYEMDIHLDTPINSDRPEMLFNTKFALKPRWMKIDEAIRERWLWGLKPRIIAHSSLERKSYRVERMSENESAHKIYIETSVRWWNKISPLRLIFADMDLFLVYEVLFHRPGGQHSYALQDLRVISTYDWNLHAKDISVLKTLITERFINPLLTKPLTVNDALITITPPTRYVAATTDKGIGHIEIAPTEQKGQAGEAPNPSTSGAAAPGPV